MAGKKKVSDIVNDLIGTKTETNEVKVTVTEQGASSGSLNTIVADVPAQVASNFSETAYGLFKDAKSGEWVVTELSYDPVTLKVKDEVKLIPSGDNTRAVGMERFRITVGRHLFNKTGE